MKEHIASARIKPSEENKSERGKKKIQLEAFTIFSWLLYYSPTPLKWFRNSHKHIQKHISEKTEAYNSLSWRHKTELGQKIG